MNTPPLTAITFPGHDEPLLCAWCRAPAHVPEFSYAGVPVTACPAVPPDHIANEELALLR
jgi:hypothetical protein